MCEKLWSSEVARAAGISYKPIVSLAAAVLRKGHKRGRGGVQSNHDNPSAGHHRSSFADPLAGGEPARLRLHRGSDAD